MRHARVLGLSSLAIVAVAAAAYAQTSVTPLPDNTPVQAQPLEIDLTKTHWGDAKAGQSKAGTCAACHGADGNPAAPIYPRLAGQSERYIAQQLALFATGQRTSGMAAVMIPFAQSLSPQDMRDVGAYFATQKAGAGVADDTPITEGPYKGLKFYQVGEQLFRGGDAARGIPACMACHGPSGAGNPGPPYPHVGGQPQDYVVRRLQEYQAGTTAYKDPAHFQIMAQVAKPLTDQEIQSLGSYIQGLHESAADAAAAPSASASAPAPAAPAEPTGQS
ncbi:MULTISPECIES: c-type cytochrome [Pseudoxanthomonas]|jgi:cytochrome c553|uniref:Cytochrome c4 n=1 Tax=Pseudoxanthomonas winnipegensis TaxID=2480810 RepID=A0A4Q8LJL1_9GAMM|nr:c-type cytochrome [Pseudoxanthomonas winnipegensis]RZZ81696.1 cytochrome c4 [Pseudoxanthomonas winnipegensis]TAA06764.1 cytochrome c4 [Pseudoxanthomonas winnipegensis]TAA16392.1 cytochrome c4 [Pseudoxanthomonas winnipegensis]TAA24202.1 cytochrome c4 [Pseudoxanthomonas winnipegensis]TAA30317.1 cytochrome c4 [Pseudoxanthomonas winnipegensis]